MFLNNYINYEKELLTDFLSVKIYDIDPGSEVLIPSVFQDSYYILYNIGHILQMNDKGIEFFCPPKSGLFGHGNIPDMYLNPKTSYKAGIFELFPGYSNVIRDRLKVAIDTYFHHLFISDRFFLSFSLNTELISLIEDIFKTGNMMDSFMSLEVESKFLHFMTRLLRTILFEDYKHNNVTATLYSRYLMIIKSLVQGHRSLDESLKQYQLDYYEFTEIHQSLAFNESLEVVFARENIKIEY